MNAYIIRTKYLGATTTKGSRIRATYVRTGRTVIVAYDHAAREPFALAADACITKCLAEGDIARSGLQELAVSEDMKRGERLHVYVPR